MRKLADAVSDFQLTVEVAVADLMDDSALVFANRVEVQTAAKEFWAGVEREAQAFCRRLSETGVE